MEGLYFDVTLDFNIVQVESNGAPLIPHSKIIA